MTPAQSSAAKIQKPSASKSKISLATAISKNAVSLAAAQNTYKENVIAVNTLVTSVLTSSLPTLNQNPPDWQDFVNAYVQANADALGWVNNVLARLLDVPSEVQSYNSIITQLLQDAKAQATILAANPSNQGALAILNNDLTGITNQMNIVTSFISGAVTAIQNFGDTLPDMANQLNTIAQKSIADANADQQQIDQLNADIAQLQADIKSLTAAIVALGIADGVALTLGVVATIAAWPVGALVWFVMGPVVAVATTYIALDAIQIKADKAKISSDQQQIQGLTADVATLNILSQNYAAMAAQTEVIEGNLQAILAEWQTLSSDVGVAVSDIQSAISDTSAANFSAVLNDINGAITEWDAAYEQAGSLILTLQVNDAQLDIGMSTTQVQAALAQGNTVGIIQYYNNLQS
jgi:TolA-binding protein